MPLSPEDVDQINVLIAQGIGRALEPLFDELFKLPSLTPSEFISSTEAMKRDQLTQESLETIKQALIRGALTFVDKETNKLTTNNPAS